MFLPKNSKGSAAANPHVVITCPNCGGDHYEDNRFDDALHREAAKEAPRLRHEGRYDDAIDVLTALAAIQIANFVRPEWLCLACGVTFDA